MTVVNEILVGVVLASSLPTIIDDTNKGSYLVSGVCDSSELDVVTVTVGEDSASLVISQEVTCSGNRFSESFDLSGVTADPATIRVVQGTNSDTATVANEILVGVVLASSLTPLTEANKLIYLVSGICDSSELGVVTVTAGENSASPEMSQEVTCSGNRFSELLDLSGVTADPATIRVVKGLIPIQRQ